VDESLLCTTCGREHTRRESCVAMEHAVYDPFDRQSAAHSVRTGETQTEQCVAPYGTMSEAIPLEHPHV